jgi:NitT/TauT family transport system ATP-binding protein
MTFTNFITKTATGGGHNKNLTRDLNGDTTDAIIEAEHISQRFTGDKGNELTVLDDISFTLHKGEIVAILGRSGAGKSTFLRILAGLVQPSSGTVAYRGTPLNGPNPGVALVFQTFALMPWLTVQDNVELGLQARGVPRKKRSEMALAAIDSIGLDGFESAYPKELSGGMRQRVGIARALVLQPDALFMDEPFSALDVLTAENLRQEVLKLWGNEEQNISSILMVTHNIEEAVQMADRVVVLGSHPGHLIAQVSVDLPRPRDKHSAEFGAMVDKLYTILTGQNPDGTAAGKDGTEQATTNSTNTTADTLSSTNGETTADTTTSPKEGVENKIGEPTKGTLADLERELADKRSNRLDGNTGNTESNDSDNDDLPNATPGGLAGLIDVVAEYPNGVDLADLASDLNFEVDDLFPLIDAGRMLDVFHVSNGHCTITKDGEAWHNADILKAKEIFASLAMDHAPLVRAIDQALRRQPNKALHGDLIRDLLRRHHNDEQMRQQFDIAVSWGRYGELFDYNADDDLLTLDEANE